jgi:hypothetical protein
LTELSRSAIDKLGFLTNLVDKHDITEKDKVGRIELRSQTRSRNRKARWLITYIINPFRGS